MTTSFSITILIADGLCSCNHAAHEIAVFLTAETGRGGSVTLDARICTS